MSRLTSTLIFLLLLVASGCGQSGPLYLPGNPSEVQQPAAEPVEEEEKNGEDDGTGGH